MPEDTSQSFSILTGRQEEKKQNRQISPFVTQCQTSLPNKYEIIDAKLAIIQNQTLPGKMFKDLCLCVGLSPYCYQYQ